MRHVSMALLTLSLGISGSFVGVEASQAQNLALPKGSSLAATPPIDQRGKQFRAMSRSQRRIYVRQGYRGAAGGATASGDMSRSMRSFAIVVLSIGLGAMGSLGGQSTGHARSLPAGSELSGTPPIDQRGKQFRVLRPSERRTAFQQGYRGPGWRQYR